MEIIKYIKICSYKMLEKHSLFITLVLVFILIISTLLFNYRSAGSGDFYYHAGIVNELQENVFEPKHPSYGTDDTTQYFTPYHLSVALFGKAGFLTAPQALMIFAIINLLIFILGLYLFTKNLYGKFNILSLIFILFLWGGVFGFSGEYSFKIISRVASYHSLFSMGLMLFCYAIALKANVYNVFLASLLGAMAIISQPISIFAVSFGVPILFMKRFGNIKKAAVFSLIYGTTILILLSLWPYYSFFEVALGQAKSASAWLGTTFPMYAPTSIIKVVWPVLLLCPLLFIDGIKKHTFPLLIAFSIIIPYIFYAPTNSQLTGRSLVFIILMIQISLAYALTNLTSSNNNWSIVLFLITPLILYNLVYGLYSRGDTSFIKPMKQEMKIVSRHLNHYDVVVTDLNTGYHLVGYNGKIVATIFPQRFVEDDNQRKIDIVKVFDPVTSNYKRKKIAEKYNAKYFLINKKKIRSKVDALFIDTNPELVDSVRKMGESVIELDQLLLIKLADSSNSVTKIGIER